MVNQPYFDLSSAKKLLAWLKPKLFEIQELSLKGQKAMDEYDLDSAEAYTLQIHDIIEKIQQKGMIIRDEEATLIDFPSVINDIPAYFCWKKGENGLSFWHYADEGFAGRRRITTEDIILSYL